MGTIEDYKIRSSTKRSPKVKMTLVYFSTRDYMVVPLTLSWWTEYRYCCNRRTASSAPKPVWGLSNDSSTELNPRSKYTPSGSLYSPERSIFHYHSEYMQRKNKGLRFQTLSILYCGQSLILWLVILNILRAHIRESYFTWVTTATCNRWYLLSQNKEGGCMSSMAAVRCRKYSYTYIKLHF